MPVTRPFISQETVKSALDAMLHPSTKREPNALDYLSIVDEFLANPDLPANAHEREFAVNYLLSNFIIQLLHSNQYNLGLQQLPVDVSLDHIKTISVEIGQQGNAELLGWFLLYCRYIRVDLGLSLESIEQIFHLDQRTLRRYQNHAILRLTEHLLNVEWEMRSQRRKRRLYAALPFGLSTSLQGREEALSYVEKILGDGKPHILLITGAPGIGKSSFVQGVLLRHINTDKLDNLIWFDNPPSTDFILQQMLDCFITNESRISLQEYLLLNRVAFVIDGVQNFQDDFDQFQMLLDQVSGALGFIISDKHFSLPNSDVHIHLTELSQEAAHTVIYETIAREYPSDTEDYMAGAVDIYNKVGGNPLALKTAVRNLHFEIADNHHSTTAINLYQPLYNMMNESVHKTWIKFALMQPGEISMEHIEQIWPSSKLDEDIAQLLQCYVLEKLQANINRFRLSTIARNLIYTQQTTSTEIKQFVNELLDDIDQSQAHISFDIREWLLLEGRIKLSEDRIMRWIQMGHADGIQRGHYGSWRIILEKFKPWHQVELLIAYAICLRHLSALADAQQILEGSMADAGREGKFQQQALALVELAALFRTRGEYQNALNVLERLDTRNIQQTNPDIDQRFRLEKAQIAIDRGSYDQAYHLLHDLPNSPRIAILNSEISLQILNFNRALEYAHEALNLVSDNETSKARIFSQLGRIYEQLNQFEQARQYSNIAVTLLEQQNDLFALSRTQSNLGCLMMEAGYLDEARTLLIQAEKTQMRLKDRVALSATRHNLQILRSRLL